MMYFMGFTAFGTYLLLLSAFIRDFDVDPQQVVNPVAGLSVTAVALAAIAVGVGVGVTLVWRRRLTAGGLIGAIMGSGFCGGLIAFVTGTPVAIRLQSSTPQSLLWWLGGLCSIGLAVFLFIGAAMARSQDWAPQKLVRIRCEKCDGTYALGKDALVTPWFAVASEFSFASNLGGESDLGNNITTPDLVRSGSLGSLEATEKQQSNVTMILSLLSEGATRWWKCEKCNQVQIYKLI